MPTAVKTAHRSIDGLPWQDLGSCHGMDSSIFFHPDGERGRARIDRLRRAKRICQTCPVLDKCLAYALETEQPFGIWGGLSERERQDLLERKHDFVFRR